jgi:hypothetical protein
MSEDKKQTFGFHEDAKKLAPAKKQKSGDKKMLDAAKVGMRKYRNTLRRLAK